MSAAEAAQLATESNEFRKNYHNHKIIGFKFYPVPGYDAKIHLHLSICGSTKLEAKENVS